MTDTPDMFNGDPKMQAVRLGIETLRFVEREPVGKYLVERAHMDRIEALEALAEANPEDTKLIRKLQNDSKVTALFLRWLDEAIEAGQVAEQNIAMEDAANKEI